MGKRIIIGFSGAIGSGKDTASIIAKHAYPNLNFRQVSFAHALKQAYQIMTGIPWQDSREFKESICPVFKIARREVLQRMGTNALRNNFDKDIWINILKSRYPEGNLLISDVRFDNEAAWIRKEGGVIIEVQRTDDMTKSIWAYHESESGVRGDFVIKNRFEPDGYGVFKAEIEDILAAILGEKAEAGEIPMQFANFVEAVDYWMQEFNVLEGGKEAAFKLYLKLLKEEIKEVEAEGFGTKKQTQELCDVLWVATALMLCAVKKDHIKPYMMQLYAANMSKADADKEAVDKYSALWDCQTHKAKSGRYFSVHKQGNKIVKGYAYKKFDLDGIF